MPGLALAGRKMMPLADLGGVKGFPCPYPAKVMDFYVVQWLGTLRRQRESGISGACGPSEAAGEHGCGFPRQFGSPPAGVLPAPERGTVCLRTSVTPPPSWPMW